MQNGWRIMVGSQLKIMHIYSYMASANVTPHDSPLRIGETINIIILLYSICKFLRHRETQFITCPIPYTAVLSHTLLWRPLRNNSNSNKFK